MILNFEEHTWKTYISEFLLNSDDVYIQLYLTPDLTLHTFTSLWPLSENVILYSVFLSRLYIQQVKTCNTSQSLENFKNS